MNDRPGELFLSSSEGSSAFRKLLELNGFVDSSRAEAHFDNLVERLGDPLRTSEFLDLLVPELGGSPDPDGALLQLLSFFESAPSPLNLLAYLFDNPAALRVLVQVSGGSPFLGQILFRTPEYFYWLMESDHLNRMRERAELAAETLRLCSSQKDPRIVLEALRRFHRREMLRIGAQDLLHISTPEETLQQVSLLADALLEAVFETVISSYCELREQDFAVLALGKLGGRELNFSSDIDLLFIYRHETDREKALRFARDFTRALSEHTNEGHLFRVDLRLRPMGSSGEIAYSLAACKNYYETWADTFDRLVLLKCRRVAGSLELGGEFLDTIEKFIYKRYLDVAALDEIRWFKQKSEAKLKESEMERHLKLGLGGIREVEFFLQAFQLLYGGQNCSLRTTGTLEGLDQLLAGGYIGLDDYKALKSAYLFLRNVENKLQLVENLQTHVIPSDEKALEKMVRRLGYRAGKDGPLLEQFRQDLENHSRRVRRRFESLFDSAEGENGGTGHLARLVSLEPQEALSLLHSSGFGPDKAEEVRDGMEVLLESPSYPHSPSRVRNLLGNLFPLMLEYAARLAHPKKLFVYLDRFAEALGTRAGFYSELIENTDLRDHFLTLMSLGDHLPEAMIRSPELTDRLADAAAPSAVSLQSFAPPVSEQGRGAEPFSRLTLRRFKHREELKIALFDLFSSSDETRPRRLLTRLSEACLRFAAENLCRRTPALQEQRFMLLGLGKLGGEELTYHSDLDLIFLFDDAAGSGEISMFREFLKDLVSELGEYTEEGRAYRVDFRLRPEGRRGALAVPFSRFQDYCENRAEAWERLAYLKARPIISQNFRMDLPDLFWKRALGPQDAANLGAIRRRVEREIGREEASETLNFKVGRGGLMDVQFVTQFLQSHNRVWQPNTAAALEALTERGCLTESQFEKLRRGWSFLLRMESRQRILSEKSVNAISRRTQENELLAWLLDFDSAERMLSRYREVTETNRGILEEVLGVGPEPD